ncbi:MAPEG family protein [Dolichospermum sp. LEGE 00240]|jgi:glutathione S-transferase|uniref:MAPEG family protein n=1 Tax=Dolichospermum sp. LEGE 00240 TaxID=1828603 RepID=UPI0018819A89|nr:MAPEG family protein [Dolichospermum sp. LEGE 00240]MDM3843950.1 MAPEG family protein [Aphanizomenon gracile PMC638.10]MDM3849366.1 MAPEG family protein [Aphanizomenon gracile PMC627.10]MDM3858185.1 MAPEG family protein [Aphanizomenon gracile PMC649.10]MDM3862637.1 MAPEG family protein [Aphanizomenon gracile PMC644.10]MBE9251116.1 MAPEG family protein [Dolichospermum sp. LEGE 00240]
MSPYPSLVTVSALVLYFVVTINVGIARAKYQVPVPQTTGNLDFERVLRVQQNTLEQLALFIPALWLFSIYVSPIWGSVLGTAWIVGRIAYAWGYYQAAEKRGPGFAISSLSGMVLILGSLVGIILSMVNPR